MKEKKDYLAVMSIQGGAGSFARGPNKLDTVNRVVRIFGSDFKNIIKLKGKEFNIDVLDVTGYNDIWWDSRGFWSGKKQIDVPHEVLTHTYK